MGALATASASARSSGRLVGVKSLSFVGVHVACLGALWTPATSRALVLCCVLYVVRMFGITAGYHRYFSHRSYRTSRWFQFVLAFIGCSALQKGPLWWAAHHRHHHQHSDEESDIHSPRQRGFWWAHLGWILSDEYNDTNLRAINDFARYPELRWLNRYYTLPGIVLAAACLLGMGLPGLIWGFFVSTVLLYHGTFLINSLCHVVGTVRYKTRDTSRNSLILALVTMGEGWHNNHHYYSTSARMGFFWWEVDFSYYALRLLAFAGFVWDLKQPATRVTNGVRPA